MGFLLGDVIEFNEERACPDAIETTDIEEQEKADIPIGNYDNKVVRPPYLQFNSSMRLVKIPELGAIQH
jgi:hypothetical protein